MYLINNIMLSVSIIFVIYMAIYTLVKGISYKQPYFVGMCACVLFYCLGALLSSMSQTAEGAFNATRVEYVGSACITVFVVLFIIDFCEIKVPSPVKISLWVVPLLIIALLWTTREHGLIYKSFEYAQSAGIGRLEVTSGPLRYVVHIYTAIGMAFALFAMIRYYIRRKKEHRLRMLLMIIGIMVPTATHLMYFLGFTILGSGTINYVPISLTVASMLFFPNVIRLGLFDVIMKASDLALESITEAYVLIDPNGRFLHANAAAGKVFPQLETLKKEEPVNTVKHWPFESIERTDLSKDIHFEMPGNKYYVANISTITNKQTLLGYIILIMDVSETVSLRIEAEKQNKTILESINYASKIQKSLLPDIKLFQSSFTDCSVIWEPRDVLGGDVYWLQRYSKGVVLCLADCTGHGTPGALLTMLVVSALDSIVMHQNCDDTAQIVYQLDQRLSSVLNVENAGKNERRIIDIDDGCDIAVLFIGMDGSVSFSSGGMPVFICDGRNVIRHKGQRLCVGEGKIKSKDDVETVSIAANPKNKFYIASDGLYEQVGVDSTADAGIKTGTETGIETGIETGVKTSIKTGVKKGRLFGYDTFEKIIMDNHDKKIADITGIVWETYEQHRGGQARRDDLALVAFRP